MRGGCAHPCLLLEDVFHLPFHPSYRGRLDVGPRQNLPQHKRVQTGDSNLRKRGTENNHVCEAVWHKGHRKTHRALSEWQHTFNGAMSASQAITSRNVF